MIALMQTLLPLPVAPAISRCGIFARSATTGSPETPLPRASASFDFARQVAGTRASPSRCAA